MKAAMRREIDHAQAVVPRERQRDIQRGLANEPPDVRTAFRYLAQTIAAREPWFAAERWNGTVHWRGVLQQIHELTVPEMWLVSRELKLAKALLEEFSKHPRLHPVQDGHFHLIDPDAVAVYNALLGYVMVLEAQQAKQQPGGTP